MLLLQPPAMVAQSNAIIIIIQYDGSKRTRQCLGVVIKYPITWKIDFRSLPDCSPFNAASSIEDEENLKFVKVVYRSVILPTPRVVLLCSLRKS